ncbi:VOC family protein [candidate division KSB1 bacterium]|nr:VOC family protein [candidate division KSB1 bacterium]
MDESIKQQMGKIEWVDLTVENADEIKDFYKSVIGWRETSVRMDGYKDYNMVGKEVNEGVAGICHARGLNAGLPAAWLIYIVVENLNESMTRCRQLGGEVISGPRYMGYYGRYCVIKDPAGAVAALFEKAL